MSYRGSYGDSPSFKTVALGSIALILLVFGVIIPLFGWITSFTKADGGHVVVVRNGGIFDTNSCRQVIQPNSSVTSAGMWSSEHPYPANQRYFKVSGAPSADSNEVIVVPTSDGKSVGIEGTLYFDVNMDAKVLCAFDDRYGTRTYPAADGKQLNAWDGEDGWNAFLASTLGNLVQNVMRQEIGKVQCAELVASCALVQNSSGQPAAVTVPNKSGNVTIQTVEDNVNKGFTQDINAILGVDVFVHPRFVLSKVDLPANVQESINNAQAMFAGISASQAALQRAQVDAETNRVRQLGYTVCPACAAIDQIKALPQGITTWAPGNGFAIAGK